MSIDLTRYPDTVERFGGSEQRAVVFLDRYAAKNDSGLPIEDQPEHMWARVAAAIAGDEEGHYLSPTARRYFDILSDFKFVPGGRILSGAGTGTEVTFYNCYVIPVETRARRSLRNVKRGETITIMPGTVLASDSREAIIDTVGVMVDIMSRGGGVGINWSVLRPRGTHLKRINATSSGPIDWMHFASTAVGTVEQGGSRRGAAMFMLDDWHPDVMAFIDAKRDLSRITNANVSVCVSDRFMRAVKNDDDWVLVFPDTSHRAYDSEWDGDLEAWYAKGYPVRSHQTIRARDLWRKLAEAAWDNGEPGVVFLERYNQWSTGKGVERIISVNPCGEQGLGPYSVCNLGAMNLAAYVPDLMPEGGAIFDYRKFEEDVRTAVRFLDRVVDANYYFLPENERAQKDLRRIGLGVMGLADALVRLGLRYGSPEAVAFTESVFRSMKHAALKESAALAKEFGPAPAWDISMLARPYLDSLLEEEFGADVFEDIGDYGLRNLFVLTQAPTGTTSILAGVNSGIEPFFALGYWREDRTGRHWVEPSAITSVRGGGEMGDEMPDYVVTANEVTVEEHIAMQAAVQKYVDSSVSKTINAPNSHTIEDVERAYTLAYRMGLKGLAYFRDGCGRAQVLTTEAKPDETPVADLGPELEKALGALVRAEAEVDRKEQVIQRYQRQFQRPESLHGRTHKTRAGTQTAYVTVNRDDKFREVEVFVSVGKSGTGIMEMGEALGRLMSIGLQKGLDLNDLIEQLDGVGNNGLLNRSLPSAIASALKADISEQARMATVEWSSPQGSGSAKVVGLVETLESSWGPESGEDFFEGPASSKPTGAIVRGVDLAKPGSDKTVVVGWDKQGRIGLGDLCPDCGSLSLVREEGCKKCHACGYSAC